MIKDVSSIIASANLGLRQDKTNYEMTRSYMKLPLTACFGFFIVVKYYTSRYFFSHHKTLSWKLSPELTHTT